ncbi:MAG: TonB family protein [Cyanobacteria bacterium J06626_4]
MSLSDFCDEQHEQEQKGLRKLLLLGLAGSVGTHVMLFGMITWLGQRTAQAEPSPIELLVMEPQQEVIPEETTEVAPAEVGQQTNNPAPAAPASVAAAPPPPAPAELVEPEPIPDEPATEVESDLTVPEEPEETEEEPEEEEESAESPEEPEEELEVATLPEIDTTQFERLRQSLQDYFDGEALESPNNEGSTGTDPNAPAADSDGDAETITRNSGLDGRPGGTNESGDGTGQGQGSRTVACQNCVLPEYPQSAIDDGVEATPGVQVDINPDGSVRSVTLTQSSGNAAIDQAAIEAARNSTFDPVSGGASVPIVYDMVLEGSDRSREASQRGDRRSVEVPAEEIETPTQTANEPASPESDTDPAAADESEPTTENDAEDSTTPAADDDTSPAAATDEDSASDEATEEPTPDEDTGSEAPTPSEPTAEPPAATNEDSGSEPEPAPPTPEPAPPTPEPTPFTPEPTPFAPEPAAEPVAEPDSEGE